MHCCCDELVAFLLYFSSGLMDVFIPFSLEYATSLSEPEISHTCMLRRADRQEQPPIECHCYQHQEIAVANLKDVHCTLQRMHSETNRVCL